MQATPNPRPVAIITGASSGIGEQTALAYARRGYALVLGARRLDKLQQVAHACEQTGGVARALATDVSRPADVQALVDAAVRDFARVDVLVNNAGFGHFGRVHELPIQDVRQIFETNFYGVLYGCQAVAPVMMRQRSGHIFNVSSVIGKRGSPFHGAYCATKFAVCGLTECLRVEMKPYRVKVTLVCPALTATEFFDHVRDGRDVRSSYVRLKGMSRPETIARRMAAVTGRTKPELVFTAGGRFLVAVSALWPRLADRIMKFYHDDLARRLGR